MSYYGSRGTAAERMQRGRIPRKDGIETNSNSNNSNDVSKGIDSYLNNYTRNTGDFTQRGSNRANGPRKKSSLVESMAANFEQKKKDPVSISVTPAIKSPSYNRLETTMPVPPLSPKTSNNNNDLKLENGSTNMKHLSVEDDESTTSPRQKPSSGARRGKQQREKRMLRQKRRSTGVVRLNGSDDESGKKDNKEESRKSEEKEVQKDSSNETEQNTLSNELSPPPSTSSYRLDSQSHAIDRARVKPDESYETNHLSSPNFKNLLKPPLPASSPSIVTQHTHLGSDNVFISGSNSSQSPTMPILNSSRRRGKRSSNEKSQHEANEKREIDELREKLATAECTVAKLTQEVGAMDSDLQQLEKENTHLKKENKMLEDENNSMLMVLRQIKD